MDEVTGVVVVAFVAFGFISSFVMLRFVAAKAARTREAAAALAPSLGLRLLEADEAFRRTYELSGQPEVADKLAKLPAPVYNFLRNNAPWVMEGERGGVRVSVFRETRGDSSRNTYTIVRAILPRPLPFTLLLRKEGSLDRLGKALLKAEDIELGDPELDPLFRIRSPDSEAARSFLIRPGIRRALLAAHEDAPGFKLTSECVDWEKNGYVTDPAIISPILDALVRLAKALGETGMA